MTNGIPLLRCIIKPNWNNGPLITGKQFMNVCIELNFPKNFICPNSKEFGWVIVRYNLWDPPNLISGWKA